MKVRRYTISWCRDCGSLAEARLCYWRCECGDDPPCEVRAAYRAAEHRERRLIFGLLGLTIAGAIFSLGRALGWI